MNIEFFDLKKHDYFLEDYRDYSRAPTEGEKEFFRPLLEDLVEDISDIAGISVEFKLYFAVTDEEKLEEDAPINFYVHGFSFPEFMEGFDRNVIMFRAVKNRENWKACMANMMAHEMAHQEYYRITENLPYKVWENILLEGHAMNIAEKVASEMGLDWRPHYRSDEKINLDEEKLLEKLDKKRSGDSEDIFENGGDFCENAEGYRISYQTVKRMSEEESLGLNELLELENERQREPVEKYLKAILR